jgi:hypothetical protein
VSPDLCDEPVQTFQAFTSDLQRMADWLVAYFGEAEHGFRLKPNENAGVPKRLFGLPKCLFGFPKPAFGKAKRIVSFRLAVLRMDQSVGIKVAPFGRY